MSLEWRNSGSNNASLFLFPCIARHKQSITNNGGTACLALIPSFTSNPDRLDEDRAVGHGSPLSMMT